MIEEKLKMTADKLPLPLTSFKMLTEKTAQKRNTHSK